MTNPFITADQKKSFGTRDEAIDFTQIKTSDFLPAIEAGIEQARAHVQKIKSNSSLANFENTLLALETASELMEQSSGIYWNLFSAHGTPEHHALAKDISPKMAAFNSEVNLDPELFKRVKAVYEQRKTLGLSIEQNQMLDKYYKGFVRNGALLSDTDKETLKKIDQELSTLGPQFSEHVLKATNTFELWITDKKDLAGLPESAIEAAAMEAEKKQKKGQWLFTLHAPSFMPFMQYADNRELRKKLWQAYNSRAYKDAQDNSDVILKIVRLRQQRSRLLGFKNHAEFILTERMAETPDTVFQFLQKLLAPSKKAAEKDLQDLRDYKKSQEGNEEIQPWDVAYYSEKLKEAKYQFNEEELRPYFQLESVVAGVFEHAKRLYGLQFKKLTDVPKYHPEVETYEVSDEAGKYIGLFYTDFFPRETKQGGAWMTTFRDQGLWWGQVRRPHVAIVCNFTKPTPTKPSLLSYDEVHTLFHEFGHALHGLLSQCQYRTVSGTSVYWDFVELPSQIMENWVKEKEGLDIFAKHYENKSSIPAELVEKVKRSLRFQTGWFSLRQLNFALLDMHWHTQEADNINDVASFEEKITAPTRLFPVFPGTNVSCGFGHIFSGGYSAGYYSYKWAEVLDADAFEFFKEKGLFNREVADSFKNNILSRGGTEHPMTLYKKFRGREPDPNALLRRDGLINL